MSFSNEVAAGKEGSLSLYEVAAGSSEFSAALYWMITHLPPISHPCIDLQPHGTVFSLWLHLLSLGVKCITRAFSQPPFFMDPRLKDQYWGSILNSNIKTHGKMILLLLFSCQVLSDFWDPVACRTPGLPVLHHLPEFAQTHVHWVGDAIQPSHPLLSPSVG